MQFHLWPVDKGKNLELAGWANGYMLVKFRGSDAQWLYGPEIPEEELKKLLRVPYPDKLFTTNIKNKFKCAKMGNRNAAS